MRQPLSYLSIEGTSGLFYLGDVIDEVLIAVLWVDLPQLCQPLQVTLDLVLLALQRQAVVHHRFDLLHLLRRVGISDCSPLHGPLVLCLLHIMLRVFKTVINRSGSSNTVTLVVVSF